MADKQTCVRLSCEAKWGYEGKQYIARILGRDPKYTFRREFIGTKSGSRREYSSISVDDPGLYECCSITRKGNKDRDFWIVLEHGGHVRMSNVTEEEAMRIARGLGAGTKVEELVTVTECEGLTSKGLPVLRIDARM